MELREFHFTAGTSQKFWTIQRKDSALIVNFGRIGTTGQAQAKPFADAVAAQREADKLIAEKLRKGYVEIGAAPGASSPPPAPVVKKTPAKAESPLPEASAAPAAETVSPASDAGPAAPAAPPARSIRLTPKDRFVVTWEDHDHLPQPASPPFAWEDALARLRAVGNSVSKWGWGEEWKRARMPAAPSPVEAKFWLVAYHLCRTKTISPAAAAGQMTEEMLGQPGIPEGLFDIFASDPNPPGNLFACLAAIVGPENMLLTEAAGRRATGSDYADLVRTFVLPYLSREQRLSARQALAELVKPMTPSNFYDGYPAAYYTAALLGCHDEMLAVLRAIPDAHYRDDEAHFIHDYYQRTQLLIFGLGSSALVESEFRRVGLKLRKREDGVAWLALTGFAALDVIADSAAAATSKDAATEAGKALLLVAAPEAAVPALRLITESKAPQIGQEWLAQNPFHAVIGLAPVAMGQGKLAEAARGFLQVMRRGAAAGLLGDALAHLPPEAAAWLRAEILEAKEDSLPVVPRDELPEPLRSAFADLKTTKAARLPDWLPVAALPSIRLQDRRLDLADVELLLGVLKSASLAEPPPPLVSALKAVADRHSLDAFAWRLFEQWESMGASSKEKWAMAALGHIGGDDCVLRLTPRIRAWPGESQNQRAVFGLDCLRAIGTDTALMALNGIAQKVKFKALKERAQVMMAGIATARGLTREQLADRIVPDVGLDARGGRDFDFGPRQFRLVLGPGMKPLVRDGAGKVRPDLPAPNQADDPAKAEAATAEWKLLKKTLRETLKIQAERLEDAMITGRRWTPEEFETLLVRHPLMINLGRLLVFAEYDAAGRVARTFRVTEDQTLADQNDAPAPAPAGPVGIVHAAHVDDAAKSAWGQVLGDYEIIPPFAQLGREICRPEPADLDATEITRFRGPKVPGIVMYGMLERSHWLRDTPADGGGFQQHSKHFPSANLTAFIAYDGLSIGYYDEPQQLQSVYFVPGHVKPDWWGEHKNRLRIREVDEVVLSEVLRLAHAIVAKAE